MKQNDTLLQFNAATAAAIQLASRLEEEGRADDAMVIIALAATTANLLRILKAGFANVDARIDTLTKSQESNLEMLSLIGEAIGNMRERVSAANSGRNSRRETRNEVYRAVVRAYLKAGKNPKPALALKEVESEAARLGDGAPPIPDKKTVAYWIKQETSQEGK